MTALRRFAPGAESPPPGPLARFLRPRQAAGETCELCAVPLEPGHRHVVDIEQQRLACACRGCALLFTTPGAARGRYHAVPERHLRLEPFLVDPLQWAALQVPVGMAFFLRRSALQRTVAFYPSPAGATESELPLDAWADIEAANPVLGGVEPDVEAAMVRMAAGAPECYVVPVDRCYELVGELRRHWHGFDGGQEVRARIERFFDDVRSRSRAVTGP